MGKSSIGNPCTKVCTFDTAGVCRGCFRTRAEARGWKRLSDAEKEAVNRRVRPLIAASDKSGGKGGAKRLRKLDKKIRKLEKKLEAFRAERRAIAADAT
ncbi:MAG TPA: DUF1289 domain-containing protein [Azospirillum sp.]|nr:DUF1289 domain-containing protein [Azospirillum sp.]